MTEEKLSKAVELRDWINQAKEDLKRLHDLRNFCVGWSDSNHREIYGLASIKKESLGLVKNVVIAELQADLAKAEQEFEAL